MRDYVTRKEYDAWISECAALAIACKYPVQDSMINDSTGLILGAGQYEAFVNGVWSREPFELFAIFESMNEPTVDGLPREAMAWAEYGGLCDKLMIVHPGKFCSAHLHWRKTEYYEVVLGEMDLFYAPEIIDMPELGIDRSEVIEMKAMPKGDPWPDDILLAEGRDESYRLLTSYKRLRPGDAKFLMPRKHLHAFGCPRDARTPLVIRENSCYSHEPTTMGKAGLLPEWQHIHDNAFLHPGVSEGRLTNSIRES
ncbi:MAG TPA: hypothetical protein VJZ50_03425 [Candidatus Limnocylindrales bacterium]|nr:hypothetical protein [Candidatus Limnocylindrales bacterium]